MRILPNQKIWNQNSLIAFHFISFLFFTSHFIVGVGAFKIIILIFQDGTSKLIKGLWPWAFFSQVLTPKFWKSLKVDGLIQTYQRGHKAVMNTHTVGGNTARTKYVGIDQYGNKYYEDFDILCSLIFSKIATKGDGSNSMTIFLSEAQTEIWFLQNGKDGFHTNTTKYQLLRVLLSMTLSSKNLMNGITPTVHLSCTLQDSQIWTCEHLITPNTGTIDTLNSGNHQQKGHE